MNVRRVNNQYSVVMPEWEARWDGWSDWEPERFRSMEQNLRPGDILFDVGAESGIQSAIYAQFVGPKNMVLFEPEPSVWPSIRMTWEMNGLGTPLGCYVGFAGADTEEPLDGLDHDPAAQDGWPRCAWDDDIVERRVYRYLHEEKHRESTRRVALDDWAWRNHRMATGITIDVEGAELDVLHGARLLLAQVRPMVWVSVHPDLSMQHYGKSDEEVHGFMHGLGYESKHLATDHEQHFFYWVPGVHKPELG